MEEKPYKYDAFISYRHVEPDMTIAARLHTMLETFTLRICVRNPKPALCVSRPGRAVGGGFVGFDTGGAPVFGQSDRDLHPADALSPWCAKG